MKQRVMTLLKGLGCLLYAAALWLFYILFLGENPTGWGEFGVFMGTAAGIILIAKSTFPTKYELRQCPNCGTVTEQFQIKRESKQLKYMCENCGRETVVPLCKTCKEAMELIDKDSEQWYCTKDGLLLYAKENRTVENIRLDLKKSAPEQAVGELEPRSPTTSEPARPGEKSKSWKEWLSQPIGAKKAAEATRPSQHEEPPREAMLTKFCRECGAKIARDSVYCEECGTRLA